MRKMVGTGILAVLLLTAGQVFADYDREAVVAVMRENQSLLGGLKEASAGGAFDAAAARLWSLATGMQSIQRFTPRKGDKADWDRTLDRFVSTAWRGIGACGQKDAAGLDAVIGELSALMQQGHAAFR